jgi:hypothetical protein
MMGVPRWIAVLALLTTTASAAQAIPAFARKYNVSCSMCHAPAPRLNAVGEAFAGNGFEFAPGEEPRDTLGTGDPLLRLQRSLPLAIRFDAYGRVQSNIAADQTSTDLQTPWVVKLLSGGPIADKISYYAYFLVTERGEVAGLEDAYVQFTDIASSGVSLIAGQFQVSDPLFKRELRLPYEDYQPYRVRVGETRADLTYDRGFMALYSPWEGGDLSLQIVSGQGLSVANDSRSYDRDNARNYAARFSQDVGPIRLGVFGYLGTERSSGVRNRFNVWGPDATVPLGSVGEVNLQYLRREDDDPFFGSCTVASPCPGGRSRPFSTVVNSILGEATLWPQGPGGRWFLSGLYNYVDSEHPVVSLRLGEQNTAPGYLRRYHTASAGVHYLHRRNVRFLWEGGWDIEKEQVRLVTGVVLAF